MLRQIDNILLYGENNHLQLKNSFNCWGFQFYCLYLILTSSYVWSVKLWYCQAKFKFSPCSVQFELRLSHKESLAHFGFFRGLKWYLFGFFRPLKSGEAFLEFSGALNDYMWAFSGAWNDTLLAFSGPWNWKSLFGVFRSLKWLYLGIFRGLKRHLIGWKRWCSDSILKQAQLEVPHSEMQVDLDS